MGRRRVRLQDIAERVGVSVATVSLVLNTKALVGNVRISERTIRAVKSTALEMGYLQQGGTVGLIVPWIRDSVETPMIESITRVFREAHYNADDREKQVAYPKLTTVDIRGNEIGDQAARMVLALIDGEAPESRIIEPELIVRESTRCRVEH